MPLPDAIKRSPRVYTLLQNQDLENLSADDLADVGDPIAIEEANEDELRRLCLVAFARMVTKGSFDGWLTGGGGILPGKFGLGMTGGDIGWPIIPSFSAASSTTSTSVLNGIAFAVPFTAPSGGITLTTSGTPGQVSYTVDTAQTSATVIFGIYSTTANGGLPNELLCKATLSAAATGEQKASFDAEVTLDEGAIYWCAYVRPTGESGTVNLAQMPDGDIPILYTYDGANKNQVYHDTTSLTDLPATFVVDANHRQASWPTFSVVISS